MLRGRLFSRGEFAASVSTSLFKCDGAIMIFKKVILNVLMIYVLFIMRAKRVVRRHRISPDYSGRKGNTDSTLAHRL